MATYIIRTEQAPVPYEGPTINQYRIEAKDKIDAVRKVLIRLGYISAGKKSRKEAQEWMKENRDTPNIWIDNIGELTIEVIRRN